MLMQQHTVENDIPVLDGTGDFVPPEVFCYFPRLNPLCCESLEVHVVFPKKSEPWQNAFPCAFPTYAELWGSVRLTYPCSLFLSLFLASLVLADSVLSTVISSS